MSHLLPALLFQEDDAIVWEPRYDGVPSFWPDLLGFALLAVAIYLHWRAAVWFIAHCRDHPTWRALRYWWPSAAAASAGLFGALADNVPDAWIIPIALPAMLLNLPLVPLMWLIGSLFESAGFGRWVVIPILIAMWPIWYGIIRFLE